MKNKLFLLTFCSLFLTGLHAPDVVKNRSVFGLGNICSMLKSKFLSKQAEKKSKFMCDFIKAREKVERLNELKDIEASCNAYLQAIKDNQQFQQGHGVDQKQEKILFDISCLNDHLNDILTLVSKCMQSLKDTMDYNESLKGSKPELSHGSVDMDVKFCFVKPKYQMFGNLSLNNFEIVVEALLQSLNTSMLQFNSEIRAHDCAIDEIIGFKGFEEELWLLHEDLSTLNDHIVNLSKITQEIVTIMKPQIKLQDSTFVFANLLIYGKNSVYYDLKGKGFDQLC